MTERPILFSAPMVRAILEGRKTQTRRIVKPQPDIVADSGLVVGVFTPEDQKYGRLGKALSCPYGQPGDRLWVREAFAGSIAYERHGYPLKEWGNKLWYLADGEPRSGQWTRPRPSIHMPRRLSRITLEVTEVRVERLNDISEDDALAEGVEGTSFLEEAERMEPATGVMPGRYAFRALWESIHGPGSWDANPWVWVVGFRRVT